VPGRLAAASPCGKRQILLTDALHIFTLPSMITKTTKEKISALLADLNTGIYEKEEVMALALLSSIAGESIFLLGPPGVAKSLIARRLKYAYEDGSAFEYLMSRFSTSDEIFGPVSISKLKEDKYVRNVEKYLPSATVVFLDEIWKARPSIQNTLLTVLNEKIFRNGETEISLPIKALISASNELPAKDEGLEALWDRFLVRLVVEGIEDEEAFNEMIAGDLHSYEDTVAGEHKITDDEYKKWNDAIKAIKIPENVFNVIHVIRAFIADYNNNDDENADKQIYISDRRWRKIIRLLRTSAFLNDRNEVDLMDCFLIWHCLWNEETERDTVYQFVRDAIEKHGYTVHLILKA
jgi:MoxR-like ATPase